MSTADRQDPKSPAAEEASLGRDVIESCLRQLVELPPELPREPLERALREALRRLASLEYSALIDPQHLQLLSEADAATRAAAGLLAEVEGGPVGQRMAHNVEVVAQNLTSCRNTTIDRLVALQQRFAAGAALPHKQPGRGPLRASVGVPALHWLDRDEPLEPQVSIRATGQLAMTPDDELSRIRAQIEDAMRSGRALDGAEQDEPSSAAVAPTPSADEASAEPVDAAGQAADSHDEDDEAAPTAAAVRTLAEQQPGKDGLHAQLRRLVRSSIEELGKLGNLRRLQDTQPWHSGLVDFEQRLLAHLDALVALGHGRNDSFDVLGEVLRFTRSGFGPDPFRSFARAFVLGCVEGQDTVRAAMIGLMQCWPVELASQRDALALASSPAIDEALSRLATEPMAELQKTALELMAARRHIDIGVMLPLLGHPDESIRSAAARCLGLCEEREAALGLLNSSLATEIEDVVVVELLRSLLLLDRAAAVAQLRQRLEEERGDPGALDRDGHRGMVRLLAVAGGGRDAALLAHAFELDGELADALGVHGHTDFITPLVAALEPRVQVGDEERKRRIDERRRRRAARALHRITGAMPPADDAEADSYQPTIEVEPWRRWLAADGVGFAANKRYRMGEPHTVAAVVDELATSGVPADHRDSDAFELAVVLGQPPMNVHDWVVRQQAELAIMRSQIEGANPPRLPPAGSWPDNL